MQQIIREKVKQPKRDPRSVLLRKAKHRAKNAGMDFNIDINDIVIPDLCPVLNIPLLAAEEYLDDYSPTLDRLNNDLGYVKGNVMVISNRANRLKNSATIRDMRHLIKFYQKIVGDYDDKTKETNAC